MKKCFRGKNHDVCRAVVVFKPVDYKITKVYIMKNYYDRVDRVEINYYAVDKVNILSRTRVCA